MSIVMGLDQHRAQITAEWIDTDDRRGVARSGGAGGSRSGCGGSLARFARSGAGGGAGGDDRVAVRGRGAAAVGAVVHLAEPAETSALRGNKKRAKSDRADARHLRELLMIRPVAGVVDPARSHPRSPRPGQAASHADRAALRVAAADPGGAVSPRVPAAPLVC